MTVSLWNGLTTKLNKINICKDKLKSHLKVMYNTDILFQKMNNKPVQFLTYQITNTRQNGIPRDTPRDTDLSLLQVLSSLNMPYILSTFVHS